jgi:hypothetical protein
MKKELINNLLYTWSLVLMTSSIAGIFGGTYLVIKMILANI